MQKQSYRHLPIQYRPYDFRTNLPILAFLGDFWNTTVHEPEFLHFHNAIEVGHCLSGEAEMHRINRSSSPCKEGCYSIIFPNHPHILTSCSPSTTWEYLYIEPRRLLETAGMQDLWQIFYMQQMIPSVISESTEGSSYYLLSLIFRELHKKKPLFEEAVHGLLIALLTEWNHMATSGTANSRPDTQESYACINRALTFIYENYSQSISIQALAEYCCISESHFRRLFKSIVGISPLDYIQHYRIQQACHLIQLNQEPLNLIAQRVGYKSLSSFNRQFQQYLSCSPSEWKKMNMTDPANYDVLSYEDPETQHVFRI